jgi:hypothetical protein
MLIIVVGGGKVTSECKVMIGGFSARSILKIIDTTVTFIANAAAAKPYNKTIMALLILNQESNEYERRPITYTARPLLTLTRIFSNQVLYPDVKIICKTTNIIIVSRRY